MRLRQLFVDHLQARLLPEPAVAAWLFFWARLVMRWQNPLVIGVTGSVGKTTTTRMIACVLGTPAAERVIGKVRSTAQNMNDDAGLPLTILGYDRWLGRGLRRKILELCMVPMRALSLALSRDYPDVLVLEFGTHWEGHLHKLVTLAPPRIGIVTIIGPAHLDRLKSIEGVVQEKSAIVLRVPASGLVILGDGHEHVGALERLASAPVTRVSGRGLELARNIARVVGQHLQIPDAAITTGLDAFAPAKRRLERTRSGDLDLIDDSYNANPLSMKLALDSLAESAKPGQRRIALLGEMGELGEHASTYHAEIGRYARLRCDKLIGVGALARHYAADHWFESSSECASAIEQLVDHGDLVLVKGSASARMVLVSRQLREWAVRTPAAAVTGT